MAIRLRPPNIDALARKGILYRNAFCNAPPRLRALTFWHPHGHLSRKLCSGKSDARDRQGAAHIPDLSRAYAQGRLFLHEQRKDGLYRSAQIRSWSDPRLWVCQNV
jgi:hypothetical protein